jgi:protein-S-isoprenylcysteine O-methyltransferase Ste14
MSDRLKGYLFVVTQFAVLAVIVVAPAGDLPWRGYVWTEFLGQLLVLGGLGIVAWSGIVLGTSLTAHPMPTSRSALRTTGPYRIARHPIYAGLLAFAIGAALAGASWLHLVAALTLIGVLSAKARFEEAFLMDRYGDDYLAYGRTVGRFSPWFGLLR